MPLSPSVSMPLCLSFSFRPLHLRRPASLTHSLLQFCLSPLRASVCHLCLSVGLPLPRPREGGPLSLARGQRPRPEAAWAPAPPTGQSWKPGSALMPPLLSPVRLSVRLCVCARGAGRQWPGCGYVLCTVLLSLAVLLAVAVTGAVLFLNHPHAPGTAPPPIVSTGPAGVNSALVTVERADSSRLTILIDPRCPDLADGFARLEGAQASVLRALAEHRAEPGPAGEQERELLDTLVDQLPRLLARASELQVECAGLRKGLGALGQGLGALQSEQGRLIQVSGAPAPGALLGLGVAATVSRPVLMSTASRNPQEPRELLPPTVQHTSLREGTLSSKSTQLEAPGSNRFPPAVLVTLAVSVASCGTNSQAKSRP